MNLINNRDSDSEDDQFNNYKKDNKNNFDDEDVKSSSSGCCGGWFGIKFVFSKIGGIVADDPVEALTACKFFILSSFI